VFQSTADSIHRPYFRFRVFGRGVAARVVKICTAFRQTRKRQQSALCGQVNGKKRSRFEETHMVLVSRLPDAHAANDKILSFSLSPFHTKFAVNAHGTVKLLFVLLNLPIIKKLF
jgi:hypothetical protein